MLVETGEARRADSAADGRIFSGRRRPCKIVSIAGFRRWASADAVL
jgi:hypothetical protein